MARSTVFRYKGQKIDPQRVGRDLNVRAVLTGRIMQRGERLVIGTELVDVAYGWQLWGERYNRKLADIFEVQEEIAREIFAKLRFRLTSEEQQRLGRRHTASTEAYQLYLKGLYHSNRYTPGELHKAIECFQGAVEEDPKYALAYVGLADCYSLLGWVGVLPPNESLPRAKAAATKALELDSQLAEAHTSFAFVTFLYDWDLTGPAREFQQAMKLSPGYAMPHYLYSWYLTLVGKLDEAASAIKRAQELDPLSLVVIAQRGFILSVARRYEEAIQVLRTAVELDPGFVRAHFFLSLIYRQIGMYQEAVAEAEEVVRLSGRGTEVLTILGSAYALAGRKSEALMVLEEMKNASQRGYVSPFDIAFIHMSLGETDQAFEWLEKAYQDRSSRMLLLRVEPAFDSLRSDPRFQDLLRRIGLPP
jgi:tetratricopeptide (TPR) repeat protein